jgi:hypothetical protein
MERLKTVKVKLVLFTYEGEDYGKYVQEGEPIIFNSIRYLYPGQEVTPEMVQNMRLTVVNALKDEIERGTFNDYESIDVFSCDHID